MPSKVKFAFDVYGIPKGILSIGESKAGDLTIMPKTSPYFGGLGTSQNLYPPPRRTEHRYSFHVSPENPKANLIKQHLKADGVPSMHSWLLTSAIKVDNAFAPLFVRRCPDLGIPYYDVTGNIRPTVIASYDPRNVTPMVAVFVGKRDREFQVEAIQDEFFNVAQIALKEFRVVILFTFMHLPSYEVGATNHITRGGVDLDYLTGKIEKTDIAPQFGYDEFGCTGLFYGEVLKAMRFFINQLVEHNAIGYKRKVERGVHFNREPILRYR